MSKSKLNLNISWQDVVKHLVRIVAAVIAVIAFNKYFPQHLIPKDTVFKILVYMCIYILVSLIVDCFFKGKKDKKRR